MPPAGPPSGSHSDAPAPAARPPRAPWRLLGRDQALLYLAGLGFLVALAAHAAILWWPSQPPLKRLRRGERAAYRLDLNRAGPAELKLLPGIGPSKAAAIVAYRQAHGPFASVSELRNVRGIGGKLADSLQDLATAGRPVPKGGPPR